MSTTVVPPSSRDVAVREEPSLLNLIARAMDNDSYDVAKLQALIGIQREIVRERAEHEFNRAMSAAQGEMQAVRRDASNDQTRSRYARLETIDAEIRPIYTEHGFSLSFSTEPATDAGSIRVVCEIAHAGGHVKRLSLEAAPDMMGAQGKVNKTALHGLGSTVSYLRRYLTCMIFNVVLTNDDDDGNAGSRAAATATRRPERVYAPADWLAPLEEQNGAKWLKNLDALLIAAHSRDEVVEIGGHHSVGTATAKAPPVVQARVAKLLSDAYARLAEEPEVAEAAAEAAGANAGDGWPG